MTQAGSTGLISARSMQAPRSSVDLRQKRSNCQSRSRHGSNIDRRDRPTGSIEVTYRNPAKANVANISRLRLWVNRAAFATGRSLPTYPEQQTLLAFVRMFQRCQNPEVAASALESFDALRIVACCVRPGRLAHAPYCRPRLRRADIAGYRFRASRQHWRDHRQDRQIDFGKWGRKSSLSVGAKGNGRLTAAP